MDYDFCVQSADDEIENNFIRAKEKELKQSLISPIYNNYYSRLMAKQRVDNRKNISSLYPDYTQLASLEFDGNNLIWIENGKPIKYYPAQSGHDDFQSSIYTNKANYGPIPEGSYVLKQGTGQDYENLSWREKAGLYRGNRWFEMPNSWGYSRVPIQPLYGTNTFNRHSMYVHGGTTLGSAGCIDLTNYNDDFYHDFKNYNDDLLLKVQYPENW